ncbi:DUF59 domain-containing protein [Terriglobus tenax]|uniref:DUF59 domain-containing protein n=1 Tax=Terriglobus tenax TaxID=1111115 RepID=UPI0021DF8DC9|nr:DUF59 domain-containing protein [Terriglobus tenax]
MTEADVRRALRDCFHPALKLSVEALGMVDQITITVDKDAPGAGIPGVPQKHIVALRLLQPSEDETANSMLAELVRNRLYGFPETGTVEVEMAEGWTADRLTDEAREQLAAQLRPQQLVQIRTS